MKKSILVTGVSGVGKTSLSRKLNQMGYRAYDMDDLPEGLFTMVDKKTGKPVQDHDNADLEKVTGMDWICDKSKLATIIKNETAPIAFYCGTASNLDDLLPFFTLVITLTVSEEAMRHRLSTRTENDFGRTSEVQDWITTWKEWWEEDMKEKGAKVLDAHGSLDEVAAEVIRLAKEAPPAD